jgi:hypothetical protein
VDASDRLCGSGAYNNISKPGPTSLQPISNNGPTASNAARPYQPRNTGSAAFNANVAAPVNNNKHRAGRSFLRGTPRTLN